MKLNDLIIKLLKIRSKVINNPEVKLYCGQCLEQNIVSGVNRVVKKENYKGRKNTKVIDYVQINGEEI